jgi:hypothetical protein
VLEPKLQLLDKRVRILDILIDIIKGFRKLQSGSPRAGLGPGKKIFLGTPQQVRTG